ncbi:sulfite exporter TauE/SafE family protein [Pseudonocardia broussonetiae]|uniref:sulfite exporter TauE/SafE family protein n=1 Tax=Pseudonocardia broussonetiae TaxID=2736640 RepID=UPI001F0377D1
MQGGLLTGLITRQRAAAAGLPVTAGGRPGGVGTDVTAPGSPWHRLGDDIAPVAGFLAGKLVSHAALGALLGTLGGAAQLSIGTRTTLQLLAGVLIIVFGLAQLGVPGFRGLVIEPPQSWMRVVRNSSRSQSALAPAMLGAATVLIPCGVTLSVQALALASGSALSGAVIMAVFVLGTAPLFALLGYAARRAATAWRGRLALVTGLIVVAMGLFTLNGGLELAGSPVAASRVVQAFGAGEPEPDVSAVSEQGGRQQVLITARTGSYSPASVQARAGVPTTLIVRSEGARGCVRSFLIPSRGVEEVLPAEGETRIDLGVLEPGTLRYSCGMGMYTGTITAA